VFTVLVLPTKIEVVWADLRPTLIFESPLTTELLCAIAVVVRSGEHVLSGAYEYMPSVGTILPAGEHSLTVWEYILHVLGGCMKMHSITCNY
jgi:hypothetical protein